MKIRISRRFSTIESYAKIQRGKEMIFSTDGRSVLRGMRLFLIRVLFKLQSVLKVIVVFRYKNFGIRFAPHSVLSAMRASSILVKEEGTVKWLENSLSRGDTFLDIGANIGTYTLYGAAIVGPTGRVFAVEPHVQNASNLIDNITENGFADRVTVLTSPLTSSRSVANFNYHDLNAGASGSQFDSTTDDCGQAYVPELTELKIATSVDDLVACGAMPVPTAVKIDVDGIEIPILEGMTETLAGEVKPRTVQVEIQRETASAVDDVLTQHGYVLDHRHYTLAGKQRIANGEDELAIAHNAVYVPANTTQS